MIPKVDRLPDLSSTAAIEQLSPVMRLHLHGLTRREAEAALFVARGLLLRQVAETMHVSPGTIKTLIQRAHEKLMCRDSRELRTALLRSGVVKAGELVDPLVDNESTFGSREINPRRTDTE